MPAEKRTMGPTATSAAPSPGKSQTWLQRFLQRPHQTFLRKATFQIHLWAGVLAALYICAIGLSGSILVFKDELMPRPHLSHPLNTAERCTPETLTAALRAATEAYPARQAVLASCPTQANPFYQVNLHASAQQGITAYLQPHSYHVAGDLDQQATWVGWMDRFHVDLLLPKNGRQWNGVGGIILCLLVLSGIVIWWPGVRNWSRGLRVDFARSWKRINYDLHSAVGIWTLVFSFVWGLTAVYFAWEAPFERAIHAISPITTARYPEEDIARLESRPVSTAAAPLDLVSVLQKASETVPDGKLEGVFFGSGRAPILTVYMARGELGDYAKTAFLYFDQLDGRLLYVWRRGENHTLGDWALWLSVPLHFGTSFGMVGKVVWAIAGLTLPLLAITGLLMYWNRWLSKQVRSSRRQS